MTTIRQARVDDAERIGTVHVAAWRSAYAGIVPASVLEAQDERVRAAFWERYVRGENWPLFVAEARGELVGFASCIPCRDPDLAGSSVSELAAIYLLEGASGKGIGTSLLRRCSAEAVECGCDAMTLWVLEANLRARRFYDARGFRLDGARTHDTGLQANEVRMRAGLPIVGAS